MKKMICFYSIVFVIAMGIFSCLLPYPILSRYTNSTEKQISKSNNYFETEHTLLEGSKNTLLDISWEDGIDALLETNHPFEIYDFKSKQYFSITRIGGINHADVVPASSEDFDFINKNFSQKKTYPVLLIFNSTSVIPASFSAYMHGYTDTQNSYYGHFCLHFKNSKTHETQNVDFYHQKNIKTAISKAKKVVKE